MKYQVLKGVVIQRTVYNAGAIVELDNKALATELMGYGKIAPYDEPAKVERSVGLDNSDEQPATRKRGRPKKVEHDD